MSEKINNGFSISDQIKNVFDGLGMTRHGKKHKKPRKGSSNRLLSLALTNNTLNNNVGVTDAAYRN